MGQVYVLNRHGHPLMPTTERKARLLRQSGRATVAGYEPYTIQLVYGSSGYTQPVTVGIDAGYETVGFSGVTESVEVLAGEMTLLEGTSERLKERAMYRRQRRSRLRHRPSRPQRQFKPEGWLAPSIRHKLDSHIRMVEKIRGIVPVRRVMVEVASFDIQLLKTPGISGIDYQQGEQAGFWNLREYILFRDEHECQNPDCPHPGQAKSLQVHHLGYWQGDRSDRPDNLITLCVLCHVPANHQPGGFLYGWQPKLKTFRAEAFMNAVRWRLVKEIGGEATFGYLTKHGRITLGLPKSHANDAFVIAGGTTQRRADPLYLEQVRRNNRSLQKFYDAQYIDARTRQKAGGQKLFSGRRTRNKTLSGDNLRVYRGQKVSKGRVSIRRQRYLFQPGDLVRYEGHKYRVKGMQNYGAYIKLEGLPRPVKTILVSPVCWRKGIYQKWPTNGKIAVSDWPLSSL
ncbi:MAG: hypothetical protein BroJett011_18820 [Chloroflexota bacterium]|nr:MAG: hypothetical protein BroJett011_18820 [Chloroflexota bacterium]